MNRQLTLNAGIFFLAAVFLTYFFSVVVFWLGGTMNGCIFPCAIAVSAVITGRLMRWDRSWLKVVGCSIAFIVVSAVACSFLADNSYDGNFYHQEGVVEIYKGWNPWHEAYTDGSIWVNHYAKMLEIVSAAIMSTTDNLESGKLVNIMLAVSSLLILSGAFAKVFPGLNRRHRWLVSLLFAANPVVVAQSLTFYNDYALYCCLVILVAMFLYIYNDIDTKVTWFVAAMVTMLAIGTKFTHFFYVGLAWAMFIVLLLASKRYAAAGKCVVAGTISLLVGGVFLGWHPYLTNAIGYGHPIYPLMGGNVDIMTNNTPEMYVGDNRFVNFIKSMMSSVRRGEWACPLIPLHPVDMLSVNTDCRINGFGPFFGLMLLSGLAILIACCRSRAVWYLVCCLLVSCFIFEQSWWARYIPFLWAVPAISVLCCMLQNRSLRWTVYARRLIVACSAVTVAVAMMICVHTKIETYAYRELLFSSVGNEPVRVDVNKARAFRHKLDAAGINYTETEFSELDKTRTMSLFGEMGYEDVPVIELPRNAYDEVTAPGWRYRLLRIHNRRVER